MVARPVAAAPLAADPPDEAADEAAEVADPRPTPRGRGRRAGGTAGGTAATGRTGGQREAGRRKSGDELQASSSTHVCSPLLHAHHPDGDGHDMSLGHRRTVAGGVGIERTLPAGKPSGRANIALCNPTVPIPGLFVRLPPKIPLFPAHEATTCAQSRLLMEEIDRASSPHRAMRHRTDPADPVGVTGRGGRTLLCSPERVASRQPSQTAAAARCAQTHARCRSRHTPTRSLGM